MKTILVLLLSLFGTSVSNSQLIMDKVQTPFKTEKELIYDPNNDIWSYDMWKAVELNYLWDGGVYEAEIGSSLNFTGANRLGLENRNTTAIHVSTFGKFVGTDGGGIYRYDATETPPRYEPMNISLAPDLVIYDIEEFNGTLYVATDHGVYRRHTSSFAWISSGSPLNTYKVNCLLKYNSCLYAGTDGDGVYRTDDGTTWTRKSKDIGSGSLHQKIVDFTFGDNKLFLIVQAGFVYVFDDPTEAWIAKSFVGFINPSAIEYVAGDPNYPALLVASKSNLTVNYSQDNGNSFSGTISWPTFDTEIPANVNDLKTYSYGSTNYLLCATDKGIFRTNKSGISWSTASKIPHTDISKPGYNNQNVRRIFVDDGSTYIYAGLWSKELYPGSVIETTPDPIYWGQYHCFAYAFHISEGGTAFTDDIQYHDGYIENEDVTNFAWDKSYHRTTVDDPLWEKIAYRDNESLIYAHAGIKDPNNPNKVISKWTTNLPLASHFPDVLHGYTTGFTKDYFTASKRVQGIAIPNEYIKIGRRIFSTQIIESGNEVKYEIAKMKGGNIILETGFHAQAGSRFHAMSSGVGPPYRKSANGKISIWNKEDAELIVQENQLVVYPNPASDFINIKPEKEFKFDEWWTMNIFLYDPRGVEVYRLLDMKSESLEIPVSFLSSGAYFLKIVLRNNTGENKVLSNRFVIK